MKVTIVVDPMFGTKPAKDLGQAYWLIDSPANRGLAGNLRDDDRYDPNSAIFSSPSHLSPLGAALNILPAVELHHPDWTELSFIGVPLDDEARLEFYNQGLELTSTPTGLVATEA